MANRREQGREVRHRYTHDLIRKLNHPSPVLLFLTPYSDLFFFFLSFFCNNDRERKRTPRPRPSLSFFLSFLLLFFFFSISDCTTRIVVTREKRSNGSSRVNVCLRLERLYNGDTCQNNWHTGVSNLPMGETSTSKESWSCVTTSRSINEFPSTGDESSNRRLLRTRICIRRMFLLSTVNYRSQLLPFFHVRAFSKNNFCLFSRIYKSHYFLYTKLIGYIFIHKNDCRSNFFIFNCV